MALVLYFDPRRSPSIRRGAVSFRMNLRSWRAKLLGPCSPVQQEPTLSFTELKLCWSCVGEFCPYPSTHRIYIGLNLSHGIGMAEHHNNKTGGSNSSRIPLPLTSEEGLSCIWYSKKNGSVWVSAYLWLILSTWHGTCRSRLSVLSPYCGKRKWESVFQRGQSSTY